MKRYIKRAGAGALLFAAVLAMAIGSVAQSGHFPFAAPFAADGTTDGTDTGTDTGETTAPALPTEEGKWYRLVNKAYDTKVIELLAEGSSIIGTGSSQVDRLWAVEGATAGADNFNYQLWRFEADPDGSGLYAMVNYTDPEGSAKITPIGGDTKTPAFWDYDHTQKHYTLSFVTDQLDANQILIHSSDCEMEYYYLHVAYGKSYAINNFEREDPSIFSFEEATPDATTDPEPEPTDRTYVSDMTLANFPSGWNDDHPSQKNLSVEGAQITIDGTVYKNGVGTHAPTHFCFKNNGASSFHGVIGLDDEVGTNGQVDINVVLLRNGCEPVYSECIRLYGNDANPRKYEINLTDLADYDYLVIDVDEGDGNGNDHVDLADAYFTGGSPESVAYSDVPVIQLPTSAEQQVVALSSLDISNATCGGGLTAKANQSVAGNALMLRKITFASGVGVHANSKIVVKLDGKATAFHALAGVDDEAKTAADHGNVNWRVILKGTNGRTEVREWVNAQRLQQPEALDIDNLEQWKYMVLEVNTNGQNYADHFDWANAYFLCPDANDTPITVTESDMNADWELRDCPDAEVSDDPLRPLLITSGDQMATNVPDGVGKLCYLIDGNTVTYWESPNVDPGDDGQWIQVDLGAGFAASLNDADGSRKAEDLVVRIRRCADNASMAPTAFEILTSDTEDGVYAHWAYTYFVYRGTGTTEYSARLPLDDAEHLFPAGTRYLRFRVTANQTKTLVSGTADSTDGTTHGVRRMRLSEFNILRLGHDTGYSATQWDRFRLNSDYLMDYYDAKFEHTRGPVDPRNHPDDTDGNKDYWRFDRWGEEKDFGKMSEWSNPVGWNALWNEDGTMKDEYAAKLTEAGITVPSFKFIDTDFYGHGFLDSEETNRHRQATHVVEHELYAIPGDAIALYPFYTFGANNGALSYDENFIHWYDYQRGGNAGGYLDMLVDPSRVVLSKDYGYFAGATNISANDRPANPLSSFTYGWKDTQRSETAISTGNLQDNGQVTKAWGRVATFFVPRNPFDESSLKPLDREYVIAADFSNSFRDVRNIETADGSKTIVEPTISYRHIFRIKDGLAFAEDFSGSPEANDNYIALHRRRISAPEGQMFELRLNSPLPKEVTTRSRLYYKISPSDYRRVCSMMLVATDASGNVVQRAQMVGNSWNTTEGIEIFTPQGEFTGYGSRTVEGVTYNACGGGGHYFRVLRVDSANANGKYRVTLYGRDYNGNPIRVYGGGENDLLKVQEIEIDFVGDDKAYFKTESELADAETGDYTEHLAHTSDAYLRELCGAPADSITYDNYNLLRTSLAADDRFKAFIGENGSGNDKVSIYKWPVGWEQSAYGFGYPIRGDWNYYTLATNSRALRYATTGNRVAAADNFGIGSGIYDRRFYDTKGAEQGFFYYVNASADPGVVARFKLGSFCTGSTIYVTAWIAEMSSNLGDRANVAFNFVAVVNDNGREVRIPLHSHISGIYPNKDKSEWMRVYFSFVPDINNDVFNGREILRYEVELDNNAKGSSGADYAIDDIRVYIANPLVYAEHINPVCNDETATDTKVKVTAPFDVLLQSLGLKEATEGSGEEQTLYYTFLDKELFEKSLKESATESGSENINVAAKAYTDAVLKYNYNGTEGGTATNFGSLTFKTVFTANDEYSSGDTGSGAAGRLTEDGERMLAINVAPRDNAGNPLTPGKEYIVYLYSPSADMDVPNGTADEDGLLSNDANLFKIEQSCAQKSTFAVRGASMVRVDGLLVNNAAVTEMCAGQQPVVSVDLLGEVFDASGQFTGEYATMARDARVNWFEGSIDEYAQLGIADAVKAFNRWNPEAQIVPAERPSDVDDATWTLFEQLRPFTLPTTGEDGTTKMPRLRLAQRFYTFPFLEPSADGTTREYSVTVLPMDVEHPGYRVCTAPTLVKIAVTNGAPKLTLGLDLPGRPTLMTDATVRVGLDRLRRVTVDRADASALTAESTALLRVPVYLTEPYTDGVTDVVAIDGDPEIYFIGTDDPAYDPDLRHPDAAMFDAVGRLVEIQAQKDGAADGQAADHVRVAFYSDFKFREGYTYRFRFGFRDNEPAPAEGAEEVSTACDGNTYFNINVVPEYVMWTGEDNRNWNNDDNWRRVSSSELSAAAPKPGKTTDATVAADGYAANAGEQAFVPDAFTKVIVAAESAEPFLLALDHQEKQDAGGKWIGNDPNPVDAAAGAMKSRRLDGMTFGIEYDLGTYDEVAGETTPENAGVAAGYMAGNRCDQIHFLPSSWLMNQQQLDYNRAWVDMEIAAGRWYSLAAPLYGVVSGEMYAPTAGGRQNTELFNDITFSTDLHNRFAPAIYQRSWNAAEANLYLSDKITPTWEEASAAIVARWSHVYNDANVGYGAGLGFSIKVDVSGVTGDTKPDKVLIRLPKADTEYRYYHHDGAADGISSGHDFTIEHNADHYKLNAESGTMTATAASADNRYFLLGNPFMAYMDMAKFLEANSDKLCKKFWVLDGSGRGAVVLGGSDNTPATGTTATILSPMQGFFVELSDAVTDGSSQTFTYNASMMVDAPAEGATTPLALTGRGGMDHLTVTAVSSGAKALVAVRDDAVAAYASDEDAALFTDATMGLGEQVYTLAGNVAAEVNAVPSLEGTGLGVVADKGADVALRFDNVPDGLMLYDADTDTATPLADGDEVEVTEGHRMVLTFSRSIDADKLAPGLTLTLVGNRIEAVTDVDEILLEVYDLAGRRLDYSRGEGPRMSLTLPGGMVVVRATDSLGRSSSGKFSIPTLR